MLPSSGSWPWTGRPSPWPGPRTRYQDEVNLNQRARSSDTENRFPVDFRPLQLTQVARPDPETTRSPTPSHVTRIRVTVDDGHRRVPDRGHANRRRLGAPADARAQAPLTGPAPNRAAGDRGLGSGGDWGAGGGEPAPSSPPTAPRPTRSRSPSLLRPPRPPRRAAPPPEAVGAGRRRGLG